MHILGQASNEPTAQEKRDEDTVFALAILMVDTHTATLMRMPNQVANSFMKAGVVLKNNPGFVGRLREAQAEMIKQVIASSRVEGELSTPVETHIAPPPDTL